MIRSRGLTLLELVIALAIMSVLMVGLGGAVMIATRSVEDVAGDANSVTTQREIVDGITRDLQFAVAFSERTDTAVTFSVPDRTGDGTAETIRYGWEGVPGVSPGPLKRRVNDGQDVVLAPSVDDFDLGYHYRTMTGAGLTDQGAAGHPLLFVTSDADSLSVGEQTRIDLLEGWGFQVTPISASASQSAFDAAVDGKEVAYVVEQDGSVLLGTKLRDATIGIVVEEAELEEEFGFTRNSISVASRLDLEIVDASHYITSPFGAGPLTILSMPAWLTALTGTSAGGLGVLAEHDLAGMNEKAFVTLDVGGDLYGGGMAAGRRVQLPWGHPSFDFDDLNADGRTLMKRAVQWAADQTVDPVTVTMGFDEVFPTSVSGVRWKQIATKVSLANPATIKSISVFVGGSPQDVRLALYSDVGGEPDALVVETVAQFSVPNDWITLGVPGYPLTPGEYWLALSFKHHGQAYRHQSGGQTRYRNHDAVLDGYLDAWGVSDDSFGISVSIYATCEE